MNVVYKTENVQKPVSALDIGDIFKHEEDFYIKTDDINENKMVCVALTGNSTGYMMTFYGSDTVIPYFNAELSV